MSKSAGSRLQRWSAAAAVVVAMVGPLALLAAWVVTASAPVVALEHPPQPVWVRSEAVQLDQSAEGLLELNWSQEQPLTYRGPGGVVTAVGLRPGLAVTNGLPAIEVDGRIIRVLVADKPLTGPVGQKSGPEELRIVADFLSANGHPVDGVGWSKSLATAIEAYGREVTGAKGAVAFDPSWIIWSPPGAGLVAKVALTPGMDAPTAGSALATLEPVLVAAELSTADRDALEQGPYLITVNDQDFTLLDDGTVDPAQLTALGRAVSDSPESVDVTIRPQSAAVGISVPAGAVIVDASGHTCVATGTDPTAPAFVEVAVVGGIPGAAYLADSQELAGADVLANPTQFELDGPCR